MNTNTLVETTVRGWIRGLVLVGITHALVGIIVGCSLSAWLTYQAGRFAMRCLWAAQKLASAVAEIVWVLILWIDGRFRRVIIVLQRIFRHAASSVRAWLSGVAHWGLREFGDPLVCAICVYLGVLSSSALPLVVLLHLMPSPLVGVVLSPLAAFAITTRVFDVRAYSRWRRSVRGRLGARMLRAYSDGVMWWLWILPPHQLTDAGA